MVAPGARNLFCVLSVMFDVWGGPETEDPGEPDFGDGRRKKKKRDY